MRPGHFDLGKEKCLAEVTARQDTKPEGGGRGAVAVEAKRHGII